jgi:hypothetical protein
MAEAEGGSEQDDVSFLRTVRQLFLIILNTNYLSLPKGKAYLANALANKRNVNELRYTVISFRSHKSLVRISYIFVELKVSVVKYNGSSNQSRHYDNKRNFGMKTRNFC